MESTVKEGRRGGDGSMHSRKRLVGRWCRGQPPHQLGSRCHRPSNWCRGQSIIEYLLVAAAVIAAILALVAGGRDSTVGTAVQDIGTQSGVAVGKAKTLLETKLGTEVH